MTGNVSVVGYRHLIEPPELGDCGDPDCRTVAVSTDPWVLAGGGESAATRAERKASAGRGVLLVASYVGRSSQAGIRVCAPCDERRLRVWIDEDLADAAAGGR
jgi:hypothetical protein